MFLQFSMLHVTPPMSTPASLNRNKDLTNEAGFVEVEKTTLQHVRFPNVFAIGDCSSSPNSKTAAAAGEYKFCSHNRSDSVDIEQLYKVLYFGV